MSRFLILSLPRSRSAWTANLLNYGKVRCGHELLASFRPEQYSSFVCSGGHRFCGSAETAGIFCADQLLDESTKLVILYRNPDDVLSSIRKFEPDYAYESVSMMQDCLEEVASNYRHLPINFDDLNNPFAVGNLLSYIAPGEVLDTGRFEMLRDFNIQVTRERMAMFFDQSKMIS